MDFFVKIVKKKIAQMVIFAKVVSNLFAMIIFTVIIKVQQNVKKIMYVRLGL